MAKQVKNGLLEVNGSVFIIPNSFTRVGGLLLESARDRMKKFSKHTLEATGVEQVEDDAILSQVWIVSEDLGTDNLADHGGVYQREDGIKGRITGFPAHLPARLFMGKNEGEIVDIIIPKEAMGDKYDFDMIMHLELSQTKFRYRTFGNFEEVFGDLWRTYKVNHPSHTATNSCEAAAMNA